MDDLCQNGPAWFTHIVHGCFAGIEHAITLVLWSNLEEKRRYNHRKPKQNKTVLNFYGTYLYWYMQDKLDILR